MTQITAIDKNEVIKVVSSTLRLIDRRLVEHGERVAYIAYRIFECGGLSESMDWKQLFLLSAFHDIGAYKTDEIDKMVQFESTDVWSHSIYGYCFLKRMTPLGPYAEAILYHHLPYAQLLEKHSAYQEYAALISFADRLDVLMLEHPDGYDFSALSEGNDGRFSPRYVELFLQANRQHSLQKELRSGAFYPVVARLAYEIDLSAQEALDYLKMLVYSIDFRSEYTVTHTINTTAISVEIGRRIGLSQEELEKLYLGAFLHDIGKIAIPLEILEFPGKLSAQQMEIMRTHVSYTEAIIEGLVNEEIAQIAVRHHEKLDGSGYPHGLTGPELTVSQRIVAIADIMSALTSTRSYKAVFSKEKTLRILQEMQRDGKLDFELCTLVILCFDEIMQATDVSRDPVISLYRMISKEYDVLSMALNT